VSEQRYTCANDQHEFVLGGPDEPGFRPCPACSPYPPAPVDWPARFRKAADVAGSEGHDDAYGNLMRVSYWLEAAPPHVVEAIGRELGGGT
jgi:hypothetical protein